VSQRNQLGVHGTLLSGSWRGGDGWPALASAAALGYDLVEIPIWDVDTFDAADLSRGLSEFNLEAVCSLVLDYDTDITSDDEATVARGRRLLERAVDLTGETGASHLGGVIYGSLGAHRDPPSPRGMAHCAETLAQVARRGQPAGVILALEVVNRYETHVLNTVEQALRLIATVGEPNIGVELDSYHMHIEEADLTSPVESCGSSLAYVQVGESHRGWLGTGQIDFDVFLRAVLRAGYTGPITFEAFSRTQMGAVTSGRLALWRDHWSGASEEVARHGREFLATHLEAARLAVFGSASGEMAR
jgi:D-psicose/D-tagatose/L-ribulose 3-epimerase